MLDDYPEQVAELVEYAMALWEGAIQSIDDVNGCMGKETESSAYASTRQPWGVMVAAPRRAIAAVASIGKGGIAVPPGAIGTDITGPFINPRTSDRIIEGVGRKQVTAANQEPECQPAEL
ncbi:MAG TPA: hypothetical protein DCS43_10485 [Verrucomicrobia bacterium]|nr:hypothetical protein [Verrucomicrobiota bacterium]